MSQEGQACSGWLRAPSACRKARGATSETVGLQRSASQPVCNLQRPHVSECDGTVVDAPCAYARPVCSRRRGRSRTRHSECGRLNSHGTVGGSTHYDGLASTAHDRGAQVRASPHSEDGPGAKAERRRALTVRSSTPGRIRAAAGDACGRAGSQKLSELEIEDLMRIQVKKVFGASERLQPVTERRHR